MNGGGDEVGRVVLDSVFQIVREDAFLQRFQFVPARFRDRQSVCVVELIHRQQRPRFSVHFRRGRIVFRSEFHLRDVPDLHLGAILFRPDHDFGEFLRRRKPSLCADRETQRDFSLHRRIADRSRGNLHILRPNCRDHIVHRHGERRQTIRIHPDPHRVFPLPERHHIADSGNPRNLILDVDRHEVAQKKRIVRPFRRGQRDDQKHVRRLLLHDHPLLLHFRGQSGRRPVHAVLNIHRVGVAVRSDVEGRVDDRRSVVGGRGAHVEHPLDAVELCLDRLDDRVAHGGRVGSRIGRHHLNQRRRDVRILRHRKHLNRNRARQKKQQRDHHRKPRPFNEKTTDHRPVSAVFCRCGVTTPPGRAFVIPSTITSSPSRSPFEI